MTSLHKLSLPNSITSDHDEAFSKDLLRQFDQKRFELGFTSQEPSPESSFQEPIQLDYVDEPEPSHSKRSSSASDLLRRSSAYLKSKLDLLKKKEEEKPTKMLMKTTISIPTAAKLRTTSMPTPPTITQYPPKPLVYSPIEPIVQQTPQDHKRLLHRISMPLMRVYDHQSIPRNKSITSFVTRRRKSEPDDHTKRKLRRGK
ncbi:uncharacterized protein B0P05DRAFT_541550 [Gilbertella persicaria]|uniref:uncharacterized protein n=1 Tax=Gilbertella persicaria TaxID=101096 RepID=UPI0022211B37|nr:uncharacterized protein B0P05DRAFT_541550 [Gilbertella persicaria]KAI8079674.1 hypothetical protein B0P05DRAFT_541550 [Gilbertella persicaria]